jgi:HlyD family secretion protein
MKADRRLAGKPALASAIERTPQPRPPSQRPAASRWRATACQGRARRRLAAGLVAALAAAAGCQPRQDPSAWSGYVEGDYVYVAAPLAGTLRTLDVQRGERVPSGAPLFALDADVERAARDEAAARLEVAQAQAADVAKGRRADEIAVIGAQLEQARAQGGLAARELARQQQLVQQGFISPSRLDDARAAAEQGRARVAELEASLRVARLPARTDERAAAAAAVQVAAEALRQSEWRAEQKRQAAPLGGRVADTYFRVGEWVGAGQPVVALLPPGHIRARFFVPEGQLGAVALGDPVTIGCDACGAPIAGHIAFIATEAEYTPPVIYSNLQRAKLVFRVEALPDPALAERLKPGQPIDVRPQAAAR